MIQQRFDRRLTLPPEKAQEILTLIGEIDECKGYWRAFTQLSPQFLNQLKKTVIVSSSGASTRIEGSHLSDDEVEELLKTANIRRLVTRDEQEVAGYLELIQEVFTAWEGIRFSENTIKHFHQILLAYSDKDDRHKGVYKFGSNRVEALDEDGKVIGIVFDPTPPHLVPKEMQELVEWTDTALIDKRFHPLLTIANFIFEFLAIHPFQDGNGRCSRILTNLLLLQNGYSFVPYVSHEKIIEENKTEYYLALKKSTSSWKTEQEDISPWILFFFKALRSQGLKARELTLKEDPGLFLSANQEAVWKLFQEEKELSRKAISEKSGIGLKTVEKITKKLVEMKKIQKLGAGRGTRYRLVS
ncbi:MAG: Fic family protein [Magnetococcales bacterium]|nr:Fic family protein [Magnetococcales bacterium]